VQRWRAKSRRCIDTCSSTRRLNARNRNWHNVTLDDWDRVIRVDLDGSFYCSKAVLPTMITQRDGLIVNVSSWAGIHGHSHRPRIRRKRVNSMTESLSMETGIHGVPRVRCANEVATPILDSRRSAIGGRKGANAAGGAARSSRSSRSAAARCINELTVSPTWNRGFVAQAKALTR
jgi:NAD(P)-dependent dehydrogenase (short-subunit alcohol dehydrogenase family)